jgi:hypothetical protein
MTVIQAAIAIAVTAAGSAAATAFSIHVIAPAPVTCPTGQPAQHWRQWEGQMPATTGGPVMKFQ